MKTLDEVIRAFDNWMPDCDSCVFYCDIYGENNCTIADALHYLKEYQKQMTDPDGDHQQLEKARKLLQDFYRNDPLTWDELREMEGKPVWVEYLKPIWVEYLRDGATYDAEWCIIKDIDDDSMHDTEGYGYGRANKYGDGYGVGWQAYRKERK